MKQLALLFAAGLLVSAPLVAATPTLTYAAAKAKKKAEPTPEQQNMRFANALSDLSRSLGTYVYVYRADGGKKGKK